MSNKQHLFYNSFSRLFIILFLILGSAYAQGIEVKGTVYDQADGSYLAGVTVVAKGLNLGVITDENGAFSLTVPDESTILVFTFIGYEQIEIEVNKQRTIDVQMQEKMSSLDEVVVVGYGTQQKRFLTGSVVSVGESEIADVPNISVQSTLQGRAAGVQVTTSDAMAGAPVLIRVRGTSSVTASSEPLYVVDGIPVTSGNYSVNNASNWNLATANETNALANINPADIESIEVLKDAAAAAIYGARGANGVVLITTKQGKKGKTKFDVGYYGGFSKETRRIEMLDAPTYLQLAKQAWVNSGRPVDNDYELFWEALLPENLSREVAEQTDTDWIDKALQRGFLQEANISASGGDEKTTFFVGSTYRDEKGIFVGNNFSRFNARVNLDHQVSKRLKLGTRTAFTFIDNDRIPISWAGGLGVAQSTALPFYPVYNEDGSYFNPMAGYNVVAELAETEMNARSNSILGNAFAQYNLLPNLFVRADVGLNNIYRKENYYKSNILRQFAIATAVLSENSNWNTNLVLNYTLSAGNHELELLGGMNTQKSTLTMNIVNGEGFSNPSLKNPQNAATVTASIQETGYSFASFFGRANYRFLDKYLFSASIRRDGSSRFGPDSRWGTFPAFSFGYILSEEKFMKNSKTISFLKLRGGYGITGNAEIGNFNYLGTYQTSNYVNNAGIVVENLDNPGLGWESSRQYDIGVDARFFEDKIQLTADVYVKHTEDLLLNVEVSALTGAETSTVNIGALRNRGMEFDLTTFNFSGKFNWTTNINASFNENVVTELAPNLSFAGLFGGGSIVEVGYPVGVRNLVRWAGIASSDMTLEVTDPLTMEPKTIEVQGGEELFINQFDELTNIYDPADRVLTGNAYPKVIGGITNQFAFKGIDFSFLFTFAAGHDLENSEQRNQSGPFGRGWNGWASLADTWEQDGDQTDVQQFHWLSQNRFYESTRYLHDASYIRLRDITLGYTLPQAWLNKMGMANLRVFVKGTNALVFTNYPGWDPEYNRDEADSDNYGKSWLPSPQAKSLTMGVNASF